jgi:predicted  nucleic acid-binding Zn-ribbon protein
MNDADIPVTGRLVICPKCGHGIQVKPPAKAWSRYMMNTCPKCGHSTFSEETFAVCPKCGLDGEQHHLERQRQDAQEKARRAVEVTLPPPPPLPTGSKFAVKQVEEEVAPRFIAPPAVQLVGGVLALVGVVSLIWGVAGLSDYYGKDWQKIIYEETNDQVSGSYVFFKYGFFPWVKVLFGAPTAVVAAMFLQLKRWALERMEWCVWGLLAVLSGKEIWDVVSWIRRSSSNASFFYYLTGVAGGVLMIILWTAVALGIIWVLRHDRITEPFDEFGT